MCFIMAVSGSGSKIQSKSVNASKFSSHTMVRSHSGFETLKKSELFLRLLFVVACWLGFVAFVNADGDPTKTAHRVLDKLGGILAHVSSCLIVSQFVTSLYVLFSTILNSSSTDHVCAGYLTTISQKISTMYPPGFSSILQWENDQPNSKIKNHLTIQIEYLMRELGENNTGSGE